MLHGYGFEKVDAIVQTGSDLFAWHDRVNLIIPGEISGLPGWSNRLLFMQLVRETFSKDGVNVRIHAIPDSRPASAASAVSLAA